MKSEEKLRSMNKTLSWKAAEAQVTVNNPASWGLDRIDQRENVLDGKFTYDTGYSPVNVYVIDSGVCISHEQFQG